MEVVAAISAVITAIATGVMIWAVYIAPQKGLGNTVEVADKGRSASAPVGGL